MANLIAARNQLLGIVAQDPRVTRVRPNGLKDVPQYRINVDWEKAGALGLPITAMEEAIEKLPPAFGFDWTGLSYQERMSGLFNSGSGTWLFAPQVSMPVFDARLWSALDATKLDRCKQLFPGPLNVPLTGLPSQPYF